MTLTVSTAEANKHLGELATTMGIRITGITDNTLTAVMPVAGNRQPLGLLHGGANAVLAETAGSLICALRAPEGTVPVGIELSCSHHRSARTGEVQAVATIVNAGRTLATIDIRITHDDRLVCTSRLTCLYKSVAS